MNLKVFLTGASRGIGAALASALAEGGAELALLARDKAKLAELVSQIRSRGGRAIPLAADVASQQEVEAAVKEAQKCLRDIDVLINAAGIQAPIGPFAENDLAAW